MDDDGGARMGRCEPYRPDRPGATGQRDGIALKTFRLCGESQAAREIGGGLRNTPGGEAPEPLNWSPEP